MLHEGKQTQPCLVGRIIIAWLRLPLKSNLSWKFFFFSFFSNDLESHWNLLWIFFFRVFHQFNKNAQPAGPAQVILSCHLKKKKKNLECDVFGVDATHGSIEFVKFLFFSFVESLLTLQREDLRLGHSLVQTKTRERNGLCYPSRQLNGGLLRFNSGSNFREIKKFFLFIDK